MMLFINWKLFLVTALLLIVTVYLFRTLGVAEGKRLKAVKQVFSQPVDAPLGQPDHDGGLAVGGHTADQIDAYQLAHRQGQPSKVGTARPDEAVDDAGTEGRQPAEKRPV